jgi:long-chain acyl-CoA synthetase
MLNQSRRRQEKKWPEGVPFEINGYEKPLYSVIDDAARIYPDKIWTLFSGAARTFSQIRDTADRVANFLGAQGVCKGDRVAIFMPNLPQYTEIFFGILKAGAICVNCNPLYKTAELNFQLKDSGARAVFTMDHPVFYPTVKGALAGTDVRTVVVCNIRNYLPRFKRFLGTLFGKIPKAGHYLPGHFLFDDVVKSARPEPPAIDIDPVRDTALILYTGGTTGVPKGACLTHAGLMSNAMATIEWVRLKDADHPKARQLEKGGAHTFLGVLPWYHSYGLTFCMIFSCLTGSRLVCIPDPRAGRPAFTELLKSIEKYRVTMVIGVPTLFSAMLNHPDINRFDLSSIVGCGTAGAPMPLAMLRQFEKMTGCIVFEGYGLTETSPAVAVSPTDPYLRVKGSVGLPYPGVDVKIVDLENGRQVLPQGQEGEIAVAGPLLMSGYWNKPLDNKRAFRTINGRRYFLTGDIGRCDENGYLFITDRKKDLILVGGFNAYPREIEDAIYGHPKVALVAVIGVPDKHSGERAKAFIQLKAGVEATEQELLDFCKKELAGYKRPHAIEFRDSLPVSAIGKVLRKDLREAEMANLDTPHS